MAKGYTVQTTFSITLIGFQKSVPVLNSNTRVPDEIKRREVEVDPLKLAQKRSWAGRWSWAGKAKLLSLRVVPQQRCNGHCPGLWLCPARRLKQQLRSALVAGQWRGDTALTLPLFWRRSTASPVFFGRYPRSSLHSLPPPPPPPSP